MAVISKLDYKGQNITKYNNGIISNINFNGVDYHFAKSTEVIGGYCENAVEEPIVDMKIIGNSVQNGEPTLEAPVEIESVGERTKNLWRTSGMTFPRTYSGITVDYDPATQIYTFNGTSTGSADIHIVRDGTEIFKINSGESCTISTHYVGGSISTSDSGYIAAMINNSSWSANMHAKCHPTTGTYATKTYTDDVTITKMYFYVFGAGVVCDNFQVKAQVEKGSTRTYYEPYGYRVPIKVSGENSIDDKFINKGKLIVEDGSMYNNTNYNTTNYLWFKAGTYTLSFDNTYTGTSSTTTRIVEFDKDKQVTKVIINDTSLRPLKSTYTFTLTSDCYIIIGLRITDLNIQIEKATTTNIYLTEPLRKFAGLADYIDYKNKKVVRYIGESIINGTEVIGIGTTAINGLIRLYVVGNYGAKIAGDNEITVHSSHYKQTTPAANWQNEEGISGYSVNDRFCIYDEAHQTVESFVAFAKEQYNNGTPIVCDYVLETPTEETINIPEISTSKGTNNFVVETTIQPSDFKINYWKQI